MKFDIGSETAALLEALARQTGTTVEKIWPWYVQQAQIEGWVFVVVLVTSALVGLVLFLANVRRADWYKGDLRAVASIIGLVILFICTIFFTLNAQSSISQILNPEYAAMNALTQHIGHLRGER